MTNQHYFVFATKLGPCGIAWTDWGLTSIQLPDRDQERTARRLQARMRAEPWTGPLPSEINACVSALQAYAQGTPSDFSSVNLCFDGLPDFNARVYCALRAVKWGETTTYGALAAVVAEPGAARAVGVAMGRNPWPIIVPCHRVLAAENKIGGFSGPGGAATKAALLHLEGSTWSGDPHAAPLLPGLLA